MKSRWIVSIAAAAAIGVAGVAGAVSIGTRDISTGTGVPGGDLPVATAANRAGAASGLPGIVDLRLASNDRGSSFTISWATSGGADSAPLYSVWVDGSQVLPRVGGSPQTLTWPSGASQVEVTVAAVGADGSYGAATSLRVDEDSRPDMAPDDAGSRVPRAGNGSAHRTGVPASGARRSGADGGVSTTGQPTSRPGTGRPTTMPGAGASTSTGTVGGKGSSTASPSAPGSRGDEPSSPSTSPSTPSTPPSVSPSKSPSRTPSPSPSASASPSPDPTGSAAVRSDPTQSNPTTSDAVVPAGASDSVPTSP